MEEIWRIREEIAREDNYDLSKHFARLRELEKQHAERLGSPLSAPPSPGLKVSEEPSS
jgi:hypothetical protein